VSVLVLVLAIPSGGALGALIRAEVTAWATRRWPAGRATGTAIVNLAGTVVLATLVGLEGDGRVAREVTLVIGVGFGGSLTTFSTWIVEAVRAVLDGDRAPAVVASVEVVGQLALGVLLAGAVLALW
jgi:fluoride exporter